MLRNERSIPDSTRCPTRPARQEKSGKQAGDPDKLAAAVLNLICSDNPPPQLLLGGDALYLVEERIDHMMQENADRET